MKVRPQIPARLAGGVIGIMLIYSGMIKVARPYDFLAAVLQYQMLGPYLATAVAAVLPFLELTIGVALLCGMCPLASSLLTVFIFLTFTLVQTLALVRGLDADCGCFGAGEKVGGASLLRTVALLGGAVFCLLSAVPPCAGSRARAGSATVALPA